jgi:hypothetical protein
MMSNTSFGVVLGTLQSERLGQDLLLQRKHAQEMRASSSFLHQTNTDSISMEVHQSRHPIELMSTQRLPSRQEAPAGLV